MPNLINHLPPPPPDRSGWPWTEAVDPAGYAGRAEWPKISIVTPSYQQGHYLEETIRSVLLQNYPNLEYIVIDGGSTDGTVDVLHKYAPWLTYWVSEPDGGIYEAMNKGIKLAKGEWIQFLGTDDRLEPGGVLMQLGQEIISHPEVDLCYGNALLDPGGGIYDGEFGIFKLFFRNICHQAIFYRKNIFEQKGEYNLRYRIKADYDLNLRCFGDPAICTRFVPICIVRYNQTGISSREQDVVFEKDKDTIIRTHFRLWQFAIYQLVKYIRKIYYFIKFKKLHLAVPRK